MFCLPLLSSFFIETTNEQTSLGHLLGGIFGLRWEMQRDAALLAAFALGDHQSGDFPKLSGTLNRSTF
jgi:hypothetical protein